MSRDKSKSEVLMEYYDKSKDDIKSWLVKRLREPVLEKVGSIYISKSEAEEIREARKNLCPGCGGTMIKKRKYFGQDFCEKCVLGFDPNNVYQKLPKKWQRR